MNPALSLRQPKQARSRQTVERILQAATRVFISEGYASATTNRIAEEVGVSVGSLYQFFPHKAALLEAIQLQWLDHLCEALDEAFGGALQQLTSLEALRAQVDAVLRIHQEVEKREPGLLRVILGPVGLEGENLRRVRRLIQERVEGWLEHAAPRLARERRRAVAQMCIHITDGLYAPEHPPLEPAAVREVQTVLLAYLAPLLEPPKELL
ncbi:MAG: hypothetical protein C4331_17750 [Meiothermus sp.]